MTNNRNVARGSRKFYAAFPVEIAAHVIVAGDKVTELFGIFDETGLLRQLGILPTN